MACQRSRRIKRMRRGERRRGKKPKSISEICNSEINTIGHVNWSLPNASHSLQEKQAWRPGLIPLIPKVILSLLKCSPSFQRNPQLRAYTTISPANSSLCLCSCPYSSLPPSSSCGTSYPRSQRDFKSILFPRVIAFCFMPPPESRNDYEFYPLLHFWRNWFCEHPNEFDAVIYFFIRCAPNLDCIELFGL